MIFASQSAGYQLFENDELSFGRMLLWPRVLLPSEHGIIYASGQLVIDNH